MGEAAIMNVLADTAQWLLTGAHWTGTDGIPARTWEHLQITLLAMLIACAIALPIGLWLGHVGRGGIVALNVAGVGRAVPTFAVLVIFAASPVGFGNRATVIAMVLFAVPPVLTNTYAGVRDVDPDVRESARAMGLTGLQVLRRVELPLALPLIAAGIRTATVQVIATATLAAYVAGGGLGRYIADGFGTLDYPEVLAGAVLVAALAILAELTLGRLQVAVTPKGLRTARAIRP
jgi:osmoprotectant transport system permease protein